ncbi:Transposase [Streptomyces sp. 2231.1]|nr:Transposase [Streptomyces sp. 2231.1]
MPTRRPYPSDLSDARWELVEPVLSAWRFERRGRALDFGRPPEHDLREIMNAILYVDRTGVQWRYLPHDFPHWNTVYGYFAKWQQEGVFAQLNGLLRQLLREKEGRDAEPSACVIDAQSVKTSTSVPAASQGIDAGKKIVGRKRNIVTDTLGLLLAVLVTAASVQDSVADTRLLDQVAAAHPGIRKVWVDGGYRQRASSSTRPPSASTWKSPPAPPGPGDSRRSRNGGRSNGPTAGSCSTDVSPATTRPCPPAPKP